MCRIRGQGVPSASLYPESQIIPNDMFCNSKVLGLRVTQPERIRACSLSALNGSRAVMFTAREVCV